MHVCIKTQENMWGEMLRICRCFNSRCAGARVPQVQTKGLPNADTAETTQASSRLTRRVSRGPAYQERGDVANSIVVVPQNVAGVAFSRLPEAQKTQQPRTNKRPNAASVSWQVNELHDTIS
jgi:hypothetical protein